MEKESPEKMFAIKEPDNSDSNVNSENIKVDGDLNSSENEEKIEQTIKSNNLTLDNFKENLNKSNINIDEKTINNYYNQIVDNKKYIQEYNTAIQELEETKKEFNSKVEEKGDSPKFSKISKQISAIEEKLADLNVEKQKKEDDIKSIINNIYNNENKTENIENVSKVENDNRQKSTFESKNNLLNLTLNSTINSENRAEEKEFLGEKTNPIDKEEETPEIKQQPVAPEKIEEKPEIKQQAVPEKVEETSEIKQQVVPEKVEETPFSSVEKKEEPEEPIKKEEGNKTESGMADMFKKLSDDMSKGFESVLNAIGSSKQSKEEPVQKPEEKKESTGKPATYEDKPKTKQHNYIDDYRKSLRSNAPLEGMVGINGLSLKANNIGSYL